jgi:hypothetical protein
VPGVVEHQNFDKTFLSDGDNVYLRKEEPLQDEILEKPPYTWEQPNYIKVLGYGSQG